VKVPQNKKNQKKKKKNEEGGDWPPPFGHGVAELALFSRPGGGLAIPLAKLVWFRLPPFGRMG